MSLEFFRSPRYWPRRPARKLRRERVLDPGIGAVRGDFRDPALPDVPGIGVGVIEIGFQPSPAVFQARFAAVRLEGARVDPARAVLLLDPRQEIVEAVAVSGDVEPEVVRKGPAAGDLEGRVLLRFQVRIAEAVGVIPGLGGPEGLHVERLGGERAPVIDQAQPRRVDGAVIVAVVVPQTEKKIQAGGEGCLGLGVSAEQAVGHHLRRAGDGRPFVRGLAFGDGEILGQALPLQDEAEGKAPARRGSPPELGLVSGEVVGTVIPELPARRAVRRQLDDGDRVVEDRGVPVIGRGAQGPRGFPAYS